MKSKSGHERHASDVKRKLQEYQMGQAKNAAMLASFHGASKPVDLSSEPISPRLAPLGSPGPITHSSWKTVHKRDMSSLVRVERW